MKPLRKTPPRDTHGWLPRTFRKIVVALVSVALIGTVLFAAAVGVSEPAAGAPVLCSTYTDDYTITVPVNGARTYEMTQYVCDDAGFSLNACGTTIGGLRWFLAGSRYLNATNGCWYEWRVANHVSYAPGTRRWGQIAFQNTNGDTRSLRFTVNPGPTPAISYTAPTGLLVSRDGTIAIDVTDHASASHATYGLQCADATGRNAAHLTSITRNGCVFTVDPVNTYTGNTTFTVPLSLAFGTATRDAVYSLGVTPPSNITFTAPSTNPQVQAGGSLNLSVDTYASDSSYTIT